MSAMYILAVAAVTPFYARCSTGSGSGVSDRWRLACR